MASNWFRSPVVFAEAKGVAGLGKAGGDGGQGPDKAGQQVPPEVYMALTYAGTLFLFTLSVPLILYGLNKLLNKIEECLGCGASSKARRLQQEALGEQRGKGGDLSSQLTLAAAVYQQQHQAKSIGGINNNLAKQMASNTNTDQGTRIHPNGMAAARQNNVQPTQRLGQLQLFQNQPKYSQFISMPGKQDGTQQLGERTTTTNTTTTTTNETIDNDQHHYQHRRDKFNIDRTRQSPLSYLDANELLMASGNTQRAAATRDHLEHVSR